MFFVCDFRENNLFLTSNVDHHHIGLETIVLFPYPRDTINTMPKLEEISDDDIDNMDMDLAEFDPSLRTPLAPKLEKTIVRSQDQEDEPPLFPKSSPADDLDDFEGEFPRGKRFTEAEMEALKSLQLLYPCYFDKNRSHKEGRRVPLSLAVENPLAVDIAEACSALFLKAVYEPEKSHPQDFGNPGRVRVAIKHQGKPESIMVNNKKHLLIKIAERMQKNPTTLETVKKLPVPQDFKGVEIKELPKVKGFKMNSIVPVFSRYTLGHPMVKSIYEARPEEPETPVQKALPKQKNKYMHVRR